MQDPIKETERLLEKIGCGRVKLGPDLEIEKVQGNLRSKEWVRKKEKDQAAFCLVTKNSYGAIVFGQSQTDGAGQLFINSSKIWKLVSKPLVMVLIMSITQSLKIKK